MPTYYEVVRDLLARAETTQGTTLDAAAEAGAAAIAAGRLLHVFGSGHSASVAAEAFHRAGGLVPVNAILEPFLSPFAPPRQVSAMERLPGLAATLLDANRVERGDLLLVASNSGINALPVEMAIEGKARGLTVVAVTSVAHSRAEAPRHASGKRLFELADHVLDNGGAPGDVAVPVPGGPEGARMGPTSGVVGAFLVNAWVVRIAERLAARGIRPPVYVSANVAGGDAHNREAEAPYRGRIRLLS
ncbi:MAG TPA: SIS domain-containing protein [Thermodesulfobacteriota bacterium]